MKMRAFDSLESKVIQELKRVEARGRYFPNRYAPWTKAILKTLAVLGGKKLWGQACNIAIPKDRDGPRAQA
jgi:hypothetical protein